MAQPSEGRQMHDGQAPSAGGLSGRLLTVEFEERIEMLGRKVKELEARP